MEKKEIDVLRDQCELAREMTDDEINEVELNLWGFKPSTFLLVRNKIEIMDLRKKWMIGKWPPGTPLRDIEHNRLHDCEAMYINCLWGPCCVWARATMEHILQIDCLEDPHIPPEFKNRIYKGFNPPIEEMKNKLKIAHEKGSDCWSDEESKLCTTMAHNGDYAVHNRIDKLTGGKTVEDYLRELGIPENKIRVNHINDEQTFLEFTIVEEELSKRAMESMRCLYRLFTLRRVP